MARPIPGRSVSSSTRRSTRAIQQSPVRLDHERKLRERLPGEDQYPRADLRMATRTRRKSRDAVRPTRRDESGGRIAGASRSVSRGCRGRQQALACLPRFVLYNGLNAGKNRENPTPPAETFHQWFKRNGEGGNERREEILGGANLPRLDRLISRNLSADRYPLVEQFGRSLVRMGGRLLAAGPSTIRSRPRDLLKGSRRVCSATPEIEGCDQILASAAAVALADVDHAIVRARCGVAETGSVLLTDTDLA